MDDVQPTTPSKKRWPTNSGTIKQVAALLFLHTRLMDHYHETNDPKLLVFADNLENQALQIANKLEHYKKEIRYLERRLAEHGEIRRSQTG